jgi:hypothetical protein
MPLVDVAAGSVIAGYRVEELAGRGGMGVVYRATQLALDRQVALKLIAPEFADDALFRQRFKRESRLAASIDHPNVIPVHEAGETNGSLFISMRWVEGTDLGTLIRRGGGLEPERATAIVAQVASALDAAHAHGLVHRDVKPANVLVAAGPFEHVYLTDFGLVKRLQASAELTRSGQLLGTIDYVAPEQVRRTGGDARADVYSLGCVLLHCLTGRVPFESDDEIATIYAHLNARPPAPSELVPELGSGLDEVVARAMAKEPEQRYQSAGELGRAALAATAGSSSTRPMAPRAARRRRGRRTLPWIGAAALAAVGVTGLVLVIDPSGDGESPVPADGTLLQAPGSSKMYVVKAGAKFGVPRGQRAVFGYPAEDARSISSAALREIPNVPREGSLIRAYRSTVVWKMQAGQRRLGRKPPGVDAVTIPSTGLRQIPRWAGGHRTTIVVAAPSTVTERRFFVLAAQVRSPNGVPVGACVFYRLGRSGRTERGNTATNHGRCEKRLNVGGLRRVRYSVHFIGDRGWRASKTVTPPIRVLPP